MTEHRFDVVFKISLRKRTLPAPNSQVFATTRRLNATTARAGATSATRAVVKR